MSLDGKFERVRLCAAWVCGSAIGFAGCCLLWTFAFQPRGALASADANRTDGVEVALPANAAPIPNVALTSVSCGSGGEMRRRWPVHRRLGALRASPAERELGRVGSPGLVAAWATNQDRQPAGQAPC